VVVDISRKNLKDPHILTDVGYKYDPWLDKYHMGEQSVDFVYLGNALPSFSMPGNLKQLYDYPTWLDITDSTNIHPLFTLTEFVEATERDPQLNLVRITYADIDTPLFEALPLDKTIVFVV